MRLVRIYLLVLVLFACVKDEAIKNILVVGHAGMGLSMDNSIYHDNSLEAISLAFNFPTCNGVEVDVRMSQDGTLWLYHDEWLEAETNEKGCVAEKTDAVLSTVNYRTVKKEKLVKLRDILPLIHEDQVLFLDLKPFNACLNEQIDFEQLMEAFEAQIDTYQDQVIIICSYEFWLTKLSQKYHVFYSTDDVSEAREKIQKYQGIQGIVIRNSAIESEDVAWIKQQGKSIFLYDIRSLKGIKRAFRKNPTGIFSDELRNALAERGYAL